MRLVAIVFVVGVWSVPRSVNAELPLAVSELKRTEPVDFGKEIMPLLKRNCLACHHAKESEGGLVLESLTTIQAGGDGGPAIVAHKADESLLLTRATGAEEPLMPPEDNDVGAVPLTADELGLLKLWIDQGAPAGESMQSEEIRWQAIPESIRSVYAMDISPDGQFAAIGRANRVVVIDLSTQSEVAKLVDESLGGGDIADRDLIQSVAFSPDGQRIATGGFRTVRLWKRTQSSAPNMPALSGVAGLLAFNSDHSAVAFVNSVGDVEVRETADNTERHRITGHASRVTGLVWTANGQRIIIAEQAGRIAVYDASSGDVVAELVTDTTIVDLDASGDGSHLVTLTGSGKSELYSVSPENDVVTLKRVHESLGAVSDATAVCWVDQPTSMVVIANAVGGLVVVEPLENKAIRNWDHGAAVESLAVSADSTRLATGGRDGKTRLWNVADAAPLATLESTPRERLVLAQTQRDVARQSNLLGKLNARTTELTESLKKETEALAKVTMDRDQAKVALEAEEKKHADAMALVQATQASLDQAKLESEQATQMLPASSKTMELAVSNVDSLQKEIQTLEAQLVAKKTSLEKFTSMVATSKSQIDEANELAAKSKAAMEKATADLATQQQALDAALAAKTKSASELMNRQQALDAAAAAVELATTAIPQHQLVLDSETRRNNLITAELELTQSFANEPGDFVSSIAFHPDGSRVATVHPDGTTRVYRASDGLPLASFDATSNLDSRVAFVGESVCRFGISERARLESLTTAWTLERTIGAIDQPTFADRVTAIQFRRDSNSLAVGGGEPSRSGNVKVFAVETGELLRDFGDIHSDTVLGLDFSPDGNTLATASADRTIQLLDVAIGSSRRTLEGHTHHVLAVAWHSDGQTLASASADQSIKVWDTKSGEVSRTITGFPKELTSIAFVDATNQIVVACANGQVRLSDVTNGAAVRNFDAAGDFLYTVTLTPDATRVLAGGQSGTVRVWNLADAAVVSELK